MREHNETMLFITPQPEQPLLAYCKNAYHIKTRKKKTNTEERHQTSPKAQHRFQAAVFKKRKMQIFYPIKTFSTVEQTNKKYKIQLTNLWIIQTTWLLLLQRARNKSNMSRGNCLSLFKNNRAVIIYIYIHMRIVI